MASADVEDLFSAAQHLLYPSIAANLIPHSDTHMAYATLTVNRYANLLRQPFSTCNNVRGEQGRVIGRASPTFGWGPQ